ncbi:PTS sugar transporter subunit IIA [Secundilactobacillus folii]|uniref:PTS mannose transporter subunit IIA n=1 Tax=Secundilactobacillus folii TaxID=2678357 RepID=A0A7X2XWS3_9LACO|nr:PTS mannose transporter subunit IIA [Secundilactobacillus folii]
MIAIIIASHGDFATGLLQSATMIFGQQENVATVAFQASEGPEDLKNKYQHALSKLDSTDSVLFLVDLWGGSPFNVASEIVAQHADQMALITGVNLPILIDAFTIRDQPLDKVVAHLETSGKSGIRHLELNSQEQEDDLL